jgi:hypothetical protein
MYTLFIDEFKKFARYINADFYVETHFSTILRFLQKVIQPHLYIEFPIEEALQRASLIWWCLHLSRAVFFVHLSTLMRRKYFGVKKRVFLLKGNPMEEKATRLEEAEDAFGKAKTLKTF